MSPDRIRAKIFYDMNQNVKNIFSRYIILEDGFIYGEISKHNAEYGVYRNDRITTALPQCENMMVTSQTVYEVNKIATVQAVSASDGCLYMHNSEGRYPIGGEIPDNMRIAVNKKMQTLIDELKEIIQHPHCVRDITMEEYRDIIGYNKVNIDFPGYPDCYMMLTVSVFPIPKKLKEITAYMRDDGGNTFSVVFTMHGPHESFTFLRKFLKIDSEAVVVEGL